MTSYSQQETDSSLLKIQGNQKKDFETSIGGAAHLNYILSSWDEAQMNKGGEIKSEVFYINMLALYKDMSIHAEYRFHSRSSGGQMLKNWTLRAQWANYGFDPQE